MIPEKPPDAPAIPEKPPTLDDPALAALIARARRLIPEVTPGEVSWAIGEYTAEWVSLALDRVEQRNHEPGKKTVRSWGFVLAILQNRRQKGWTPPEVKPAPPPAPATKKPPEPLASPPLLSAEQVAELVAASRRPGALGRLAGSQIRRAILDGEIPTELLSTIPAELRPLPAGSEVPACNTGS
jgi:hypothetical protein